MPAVEDVIAMEYESSERLGVLWRSQGEAFLEEQAAAVLADVDRLRSSYMKGLEARDVDVIDLRDWDVTGVACSREGHGDVEAVVRCTNCRGSVCAQCVVRPEATHGEALCTECALVLGGVHHKRARPVVAPGRPGLPIRR
jgi:hypothetical protein